MRLTIALGGNAILKPGQKGRASEQLANVYQSCQQIGELAAAGHEIVITHGNGPQVGNILLQQASSQEIPALPLDFCGAQTQGFIGYMIQNSLLNVFRDKNINIHSTSVVTQVLVDEDDSAFKQPSKPVGPFFDQEHALKQESEKGEKWVEDSGRGWRRVVPSPEPLKIMEKELINDLIEKKRLVIAAGGGGIPVVETEAGFKGIEAVIDKDRAGCILAQNTNSDFFLILTDVDNVMINYGTAEEKALKEVSISEIEKHLAEGQFGKGSMAPKVESAVKFVREGGRKAVITSLDKVRAAVRGEAGTIIRGNNS
ncbi:carbamate kinase [Halanaerobium saccharolyticum]|uniref:Carbamate kinase n=1 Tax=Halanaerobium saccharolyticum TaxID=43595 RepID=A0A4R7Z762_9FIRM|nr:carbamate kinase [Halanaerobium saccharolyticum]RAK09383.1 carbamate kinase [Halanaerobium saccharolyticum]TDW06242.1 carbamate kinase [Halanaerobium saccharolyticum]TDX61036.1 carbamate kinase [Halanaerobium saccharolyticum]